MDEELRQEAYNILQQEEHKISKTLPRYGIGIVEVTRLIDTFTVLPHQFHHLSETNRDLLQYGINKALKITLQNAQDHPFFAFSSVKSTA